MNLQIFSVRDIKDYYSAGYNNLNASDDYSTVMMNALDIYPNLNEGLAGDIKFEIADIKLDFNFGLRIDIPSGDYHVKISDYISNTIFFDGDVSNTRLVSFEKYYVPWQIDVSFNGKLSFTHKFDLNGKSVLVHIFGKVIGDTLALLPYVRDFQRIHNANVRLILPNSLREFAAHVYPELKQVTVNNYDTYATFYPMVMFTNTNVLTLNHNAAPTSFLCANNFGFCHIAKNSKFISTTPRQIPDPYVCISVQGSKVNKAWLYPNGWEIVTNYLIQIGYRVVCIDKDKESFYNDFVVKRPARAEDFTGNYSIMHRANMLYHADFFVGLSSGLAWLADAVECPVVLIAGFTQDWFEFYTPYRVANRFVCNGCFNDNRVVFAADFCMYHRNSKRELECSKKISPRMVIDAINNLIRDKGGDLNAGRQ